MSGISNGTVCTEQELRLVGPGYVLVPLTGRLTYRRDDPYAVTLTLDLVTGDRPDWTFARDLLAAALRGPAGTGEVQAWPTPGAEGTVTITLGPPGAAARFEASAAGVAEFLAETYDLVPAGREGDRLDLDDAIARLLRQG